MDKKKYYKKIFGYFKGKYKLIIVYAILCLFIVVLNTIKPMLSAKSIKAVTSVDLDAMIKYAFLIFGINILENVVSFFSSDCSDRIQDDVEILIKKDISGELFDLEMKNFDKEGTGFFTTRINSEPAKLAGIFNRIRYNFTDLLSSIGVFIYIFYLNYIMGIYFLMLSVISFFMGCKRTKRWEERSKKVNIMNEKYSSNFDELIRGIKDIKVLNLKDTLIKRVAKEQKELTKFYYEMSKKDSLYWKFENLFYELKDFFFIVLGVILIKNSLLTGANFLVIYMYKGRTLSFVSSINNCYRNYKDFNLSLERVYEIVGDDKYPKEKFGNISLPQLKGNIEFKNAKFSYDKNEVLKGLSFKIDKNETIGIVGKSGVGKSTIFNLINKLYNVANGEIFIDGVDINDLDEKTLRGNISTITQNPYIFNMSIKDNLKIVNPSISDEEIVEKCKLCLLDEYIDELDKKYDTLVGENGLILSGGLKQRLAIARALVKNSKIILLDEATSSLDNETQDHIQKSIKRIRKDYTILIIAHRLSTVIDCDKILVIDDGKVAGFDTHENLVKNNKIYRSLYKKELR